MISFIYALEVKECRVSEAYLEWSKLSNEEKKNYIEPNYCESNGLEFNSNVVNTRNNQNYPSYYLSVSSDVKDQNITPTCWAFSSTSVVESFFLKNYGEKVNFSVGHLNYMESQSFYDIKSNSKGSNRSVNSGGNYNISGLYYINRYGPIYESELNTNTNTTLYILPNINSKSVIDENFNISHDVIWKSSNTNVASIDKNGKLITKKKGKTIITATDSNGNIITKEVKVIK